MRYDVINDVIKSFKIWYLSWKHRQRSKLEKSCLLNKGFATKESFDMTSLMTSSKASKFDISVKNIYRHLNFGKVVYWTRGLQRARLKSRKGIWKLPAMLDGLLPTRHKTPEVFRVDQNTQINPNEWQVITFMELSLLFDWRKYWSTTYLQTTFTFCYILIHFDTQLKYCSYWRLWSAQGDNPSIVKGKTPKGV